MKIKPFLLLISTLLLSQWTYSACVDNVVLVHGNGGNETNFATTLTKLSQEGYSPDEIYNVGWGSLNPAMNNHRGSEEYPVRNDIQDAINASCTGKIDVIGHSMGVTLAAQQIMKLGVASKVDTFIGIAGANRGLWTCGRYPFYAPTPTCGRYGLSINSPFLRSIDDVDLGDRVYSFISYIDQFNCGTGVCTVNGVHTSKLPNETDSFTFAYGHFGLLQFTADEQVDLLR